MNSIKERTVLENEIRKSRFIAIATPVLNEEDVANTLQHIRKDYPSANHYTYAYILGDLGMIQKASDDGEPSRTAGFPILDVLLRQHLTNILMVVVRYFGGIKLGVGGLIRAYSSSASQVLKQVILTKKITTYDCIVTCSYDHIGDVDKYLRENTTLGEVLYDSEITFHFQVHSDAYNEVKEQLFHKNNYQDTLKILQEFSEYA